MPEVATERVHPPALVRHFLLRCFVTPREPFVWVRTLVLQEPEKTMMLVPPAPLAPRAILVLTPVTVELPPIVVFRLAVVLAHVHRAMCVELHGEKILALRPVLASYRVPPLRHVPPLNPNSIAAPPATFACSKGSKTHLQHPSTDGQDENSLDGGVVGGTFALGFRCDLDGIRFHVGSEIYPIQIHCKGGHTLGNEFECDPFSGLSGGFHKKGHFFQKVKVLRGWSCDGQR